MLSPDKFHCLLDELPLHLVPRRSWHRESAGSRENDWKINPACVILQRGEIPPALEDRAQLLQSFSLETATAWVRDPATGSLSPFWLGTEFERIVSRLARGASVGSLQSKTWAILSRAGILTRDVGAKARSSDWTTVATQAARMFRERNYCPLPSVIHPFNLAALRRYYRNAIRSGAIQLGDEQSSRRYVAHNEPIAKFFHRQIANVVSAIVGEPVKPSYVYLASYLEGAELKKHTDREQCEFSVTLCLDFSPEPELATSWPICLDTPAGTVKVYQALGDGLVYRGTKIPHYRSTLAVGHTSTSIFFHYVPADFAGSLD